MLHVQKDCSEIEKEKDSMSVNIYILEMPARKIMI